MKDCKIYVDGRSREVQEKLLKLGAKWGGSDISIKNSHYPFLYVNDNKIGADNDMFYFKNDPTPEIKVDDLLAMEVEHEFKAGDAVLVRTDDKYSWKYSIYSHIEQDKKFKHVCIGAAWKQCISFKGNEHLVGTSNEPIT